MNLRNLRAKNWLLAAAGLAVCGCTASPPVRTDLVQFDTPGKWVAAKRSGEIDSDWIKSFRDRRLEGLVQEVWRNNYDMKLAAARIKTAAANAKLAGADLYPKLDIKGQGSRQSQIFIGLPLGDSGGGGASQDPTAAGDPAATGGSADQGGGDDILKSLNNQFGASLDISWELDIWGRVRAGEAAAIAEFDAARANFGGTRVSLAAQTAKTWFALIEAEEQLQLAQNTLKSFKVSEETIRGGFEIADQPASQLRLAMSDVASAKAVVEERHALKAQVVRQLETLLGKYPEGKLQSPRKLPTAPKPPPPGLPSDLLLRRPDLVAAERTVAATDKRLKEAKLALLPRISLTGSAGTLTEEFRHLLDTDFSVWNLALNVIQPLFDARLWGGIGLRKAQIEEALMQYQQTAINAFREVETALAVDSYLARRESALAEAAKHSDAAYEEALRDYRDGNGDVLTLLTAQRRRFTANGSYISIRRLRLDNRIDLHLALGGGFRAKKP